jgi:signal transduction histidine kinase
MAAGASEQGAVSVEALELFVEVLSQSDRGEGGDGFYDRLCSAICRVARMRRAVIFRYDSDSRQVRAAGAHALDITRFAGEHVSVDSAPIAGRALKLDEVVEAVGDLRGQFPPEYAVLVEEPARLVCAPMTAAGRAVGVIFTDRGLDQPPLDAAERHLLWTLGKAAALASVARSVATQTENARQLQQRIDLAREVHEGVIQRLFGTSMVLDGAGDLPADVRARCAIEIQLALGELREAIQRPLGRSSRATRTTFGSEVKRLSDANPDLGVRFVAGEPGDVPERLEPLAQSVLLEAVRNARKHARPTEVLVSTSRSDDAFVLEVLNDGLRGGAPQQPGMGLRLAAFEALQSGGIVEFGPQGDKRWQVRLVVPVGDEGVDG